MITLTTTRLLTTLVKFTVLSKTGKPTFRITEYPDNQITHISYTAALILALYDGYNYDSTLIRRSFDGRSTAYQK